MDGCELASFLARKHVFLEYVISYAYHEYTMSFHVYRPACLRKLANVSCRNSQGEYVYL
jgi:hypothetical protein